MATTDPIIIPIEGDPSDFVKDAGKVNAELDKMAGHTSKASAANTGMAQASKAAGISITDLRSAYMIAADAARIAGQIWQATGQEFVNYAEQVKNLSRNIGASAEETSRLIQVADDVRVSYESLSVAMKFAQKNGVEVSIESMAVLADRYNALSSPIEKQNLLMKNFGRGGLEMGKLLSKGGNEIRKMSGAINENLIMTDKGIAASDKYQAKLDDLGDSWKGLSIEMGAVAVTPVTNALVNVNDLLLTGEGYIKKAGEAWSGFTDKNKKAGEVLTRVGDFLLKTFVPLSALTKDYSDNTDDATGATEDLTAAQMDEAASAEASAKATDAQKEAVKAATDALDDYKKQLDEVSKANQDSESFISPMQIL